VTCRELTDFLMDYLDGALSEGQRVCFEEHLAECPDCVAYLSSYREAIRLGKTACEADDGSITADVPEELVHAVLAAFAQKSLDLPQTL
jgi:anti-sigma factor RsiW